MYNCGCEDCQKQTTVFNLGISDTFKQLLKDGEKAFKHLHKKGNYKPEDLQTEKPYQNLIKSTFDVFDFAIKDNDIPEVMRTALQDNARLFGSLKTNAQLFEASKLLLNDSGNLKPFSELSKEFGQLNVNYNQNYLEAEYEFAVATSQAAAQWANLGDRYNLQYRTAQDERVRASHQVLADITLPKEDPFWNSFYPPNGWRCRCVAVEVLKGKYDESDSEASITKGDKATTEIGKDGKNRLEIFRFNPGAQKVVFPPAHPYGKVKGAKTVESISEKSFSKELQHSTKERLVDGKVTVKRSELKTPISFTSKGIKEAFNQPHYNKKAKNELVANIDTVLKDAKYLGSENDFKNNPMVAHIHVFETIIDDKKTYLINRELKTGEIHFYSVSDGEKVIKGIKK